MNWRLIENSLLLSFATSFLALSLGFVVALWFLSLRKPWPTLLIAAAVVSWALPPFLVTNAWLFWFGNMGVAPPWIKFNVYSLPGTILIMASQYWPVAFWIIAGNLKKLEPSCFDSEPLLTGPRLVRFCLPAARSAFFQAGAIIFILALNNFSIPSILQVKVLPVEIWLNFNTTFDYGALWLMAWPLVVGPLLLLVLLRSTEVSWPRLSGAFAASHFRARLGGQFFWSLTGISGFIFLVSLGLPFSELLRHQTWRAFLPSAAAGYPALTQTLLFSSLSATGILLIALTVRNKGLGFAAWLCFLIPGMVLGAGLIFVFGKLRLDFISQGIGIIVFLFIIRFLAPSLGLVRRALQGMDGNLKDWALLHGATPWQMFWKVQLPLLAPQLAIAWFLPYLFCLWEIETLVLLIPPGVETVSLRIFNLLHYGHNADVNALSVWLLILALVPLLVWSLGRQCVRCISFALFFMVVGGGCGGGKAIENPLTSQFFESIKIIGVRGVGVGEFNKPRSVALDRQDNLYVVDITGRVQKFGSNATFLRSWQMSQTDLGKPKGMYLDTDGNIIVLEPHYSRANHFSTDGKLVVFWGQRGTNEGQLSFPRAVAVNSAGEIYISEYGLAERVQRFAGKDKNFLGAFGSPGANASQFNRPEGLGLDLSGNVYVADSCNHRIQVFDKEGKFLRAYGRPGKGKGELSYPYDIRVDSSGNQFVCEFGNSRIQIFDRQDRPLEIIGGPGTLPGQMSNPWSIAFDSQGNLYIADSGNHRVQKLVRRHSSLQSLHPSVPKGAPEA